MSQKNNLNELYQLYLTALLHDIGKFYQRYNAFSGREESSLKPEIKKLESVFCPSKRGVYSHHHVLWTAQFFLENSKKINKIFGLKDGDESLMRIAALHHAATPNDKLAFIIQQADRLSSGERVSKEKADESEKELTEKEKYFRIPLRSIFDYVKISDANISSKGSTFVKTIPMTIKELPHTNEKNYVPNYEIWNDFINDFNKIPDCLSPKNFILTVASLMQKFAYCIPSSAINEPDVSLYDHSKTTAFLAASMYYFLKENPDIQFPLTDDVKPFVLLGGDISGIQEFIYDIPSKGAAKQLKARSFYLHMLGEIIVRHILNDFDLLYLNSIYSSGGNFYLLLPNLKNISEKVKKLRKEINEQILNKLGTNIYLALDYEEVSVSTLKNLTNNNNFNINQETISDVWDRLISEKTHREKNKRYFDVLKEKYDEFFIPTSHEKKHEPLKAAKRNLEEFGRQLKESDYIVITEDKISGFENDQIFDVGLSYKAHLYKNFPENIENAEIIYLNKTDILEITKGDNQKKLVQRNNAYRFDFYGGNDYPTSEQTEDEDEEIDAAQNNKKYNRIKTFEELAQGADFDRLGVVRMDVDNLGKIFAKGFIPESRTFSRLTALSRNLDFFFKGYINAIWNQDKYNNDTYILYSGGDDVFLVGRWDKTIELAYEIKLKFEEFTNSVQFGISGGIAIETTKYPIRRAALNAGIEEKKAKEFKIQEERIIKEGNYAPPYEKNAFALFGTALSWQSDFPKVLEMKNVLKEELSRNRLPHNFVNMLKRFYLMQQEQRRKKFSESWRWLAAYYLQKAKSQLKGKDIEAKKLIDDIKISVFADVYKFNGKDEPLNSNYPFLHLLSIAARWAELELKTEK